jgi:type II secretory pathway component PulF
MSFDSLIKVLKPLKTLAKRPLFGVEILAELLDKEIDRTELKRILGFDLGDETQLRKILPKKHYVRFCRLALVTEQRKALRIILSSVQIEDTLKNALIKALLYPIFLFGLSLMMMVFVDGVLFKTFSSMLNFMGSAVEFSLYQNLIRGVMIVDLAAIVMILMLLILIKQNTLKVYQWFAAHWIDNPWTQLNSYHFVSKFVSFYRLGGSFDEIFSQIQWSSELVLSHGCVQAIRALRSGEPLSLAVTLIDPGLELYFKMNEEGVSIETHLINHNRIQEIVITHRIKQLGKIVLAYSYFKVTLIIVVIYQMMLKPLEMMGNYL